jgi:lipopolysaccharide transport system permease protein
VTTTRQQELGWQPERPGLEGPDAVPITVIRPSRGWEALDLKELWEYRELLYFMVWRTLKVRYKQTVLGASWAVLQPVLTMTIFSVFFGMLAKVSSDGYPYPIFNYTALLPWQLFARAVTDSSDSLVTNQRLVTKVYFPRLVLPLSAVLAGLADFVVAFIVLLGLMLHYNIKLTTHAWALPLFILLTMAAALGVGLWASALNVRYRDVHHIIPFVIQLWFYATPIVYSSSLIPEGFRALYGLNPMTGVVEGFRWALLGSRAWGTRTLVVVSALAVGVVLIGGLAYFRRVEKTFADVV